MGQYWDIGKCRDCGKQRKVKHKEWIRAAAPRCYDCGGGLDPSEPAQEEHAGHHDEVKQRELDGRQKSSGASRVPRTQRKRLRARAWKGKEKMTDLDFVGEKGDERLEEIRHHVKEMEKLFEDGGGVAAEEHLTADLKWLLKYVSFLKGNLRAHSNGLN